MTDRLTPQQRHKNMAAVRARDTKPELTVRRYLHACGFRYRLGDPRLPGHPDIVLKKYRTAIFVNGCFWHGHDDCRYFRLPKTNTPFWEAKIMRNKARDTASLRALAALGWHTVTVWECTLKGHQREATLAALAHTLDRIYLRDRTISHVSVPYAAADDAPAFAAEPTEDVTP